MKAETAKEKCIREAYGEYFDRIKISVSDNGWIDYSDIDINIFRELNCYSFSSSCKNTVRPKSLQGIETNNGWISYVGNSLGRLDIVYTDKENVYPYSVYISYSSINEIETITHYQQISCPPKPLY